MTAAGSETITLAELAGESGLVAATVTIGAPAAGRVPWELRVRNLGVDAVTITNPYEGAGYHLIDGAGTPVQVKAPPSQAKVHVTRDPAEKLAYLDLTGATVDGESVATDEFIRSPSLDLRAGGEIVMSVAITSSIDPHGRARLDTVPHGDYQLVVTVRVVVTVDGERHPIRLRTEHDLAVTVA